MIEAEQLHARILEKLDLTREVEDEELTGIIYQVLQEAGQKEYIPLKIRTALGKELFNAFRKLDLLQDFLEDDEITEVMINGVQSIFYEKHGKLYEAERHFLSREKLEDVIQQIVAGSNRIVNEASPIVDARLPDGSRVNVVLAPVALNGPIVTIRKFPKDAITMEQLIAWDSVSEEVTEFLAMLVVAGYNIFISGGTGSGKTTFLNALSQYIPKTERIITIEDNAELKIQDVSNLVSLEARNANVEGNGAITIRDLIKSALRMRPDRIIVGEVRSAEAIDMLQALNTGHDGSLSTGHANSPKDMLARLETMVLMGMDIPLPAVRRQIASGIDIIVHLGRLRDKSRKLLAVTEVMGYEAGEVILKPLYTFEETGEVHGKIQGIWRKERELENITKLLAAGCKTGRTNEMAGQTAVLLALTAWLYYREIWAVVFLIPVGILYYRMKKKECVRKKQQVFLLEFKEMIQSLAAGLNTGYSVENAVRETQKELMMVYPKEEVISKELAVMTRKLRLSMSMEQVFDEFARRVDMEDVRNFSVVFTAAKKSGGDMIAIIRNTVDQISGKIEVKREIETLLAAKKYEYKVMSIIPYAIIAYMRLSFPEFMSYLYGNILGIGVMSVCLGIYAGAYVLGAKMVDIEV